ncbi:hypothetical protein [Brevibacterium aurantiacum]|uniref:Uncharacterized protein n=1 Tax=Brevibacterium aurantiacum TaxID=273384 RepID=A0A556C367_BREAU|nr:hypothetical protein [Brevibacterium aurantiacum]TSI11904.1 hypothetical protein FO013_21335 [Brevibacterium aurantiacum]
MFDLAQYRTEPIQVTLNVAELVLVEEGSPGGPRSYDDAVYEARDDDDLATEISHQYVEAYSAYAERFTAAVQAEAEKHPGLSGLVTVTVDTNITTGTLDAPGVENPSEGDSDPLVWHFWSNARENVGLPMIQGGP